MVEREREEIMEEEEEGWWRGGVGSIYKREGSNLKEGLFWGHLSMFGEGLPNKSNATRTNKGFTWVMSQRATTVQLPRRARLENSKGFCLAMTTSVMLCCYKRAQSSMILIVERVSWLMDRRRG